MPIDRVVCDAEQLATLSNSGRDWNLTDVKLDGAYAYLPTISRLVQVHNLLMCQIIQLKNGPNSWPSIPCSVFFSPLSSVGTLIYLSHKS